jgi:hypothetical protein
MFWENAIAILLLWGRSLTDSLKACSLSSWRDIRLLYILGLCAEIFIFIELYLTDCGSFFPKPSDRTTLKYENREAIALEERQPVNESQAIASCSLAGKVFNLAIAPLQFWENAITFADSQKRERD